jgi:sugar diacid utilization regulator
VSRSQREQNVREVEVARTEAIPTAQAGVLRLVEGFRARMDEIVDGAVRAMEEEIPTYGPAGPTMLENVREHVRLHFEALMSSLAEARPITPDDLLFIRPAATLRARQGVPLADFMRAFGIGQREIWNALASEADDEETRAAALSVVGQVIDYVNVASTHAAEVYVEVEQLLHAHGERVRRDLLGDLLDGQPPEPGPRLNAAREAGLDVATNCFVISATALSQPDDEYALRSAAGALARACGGRLAPLAVVRRDEIVVVAPTQGRDLGTLSDSLRGAHEKLAGSGLPLAIGVSTVQPGLDRVPGAYREACAARELVPPDGGVLALPALRAFDHLVLIGGDTAERLISARVREFVEQDLAEGGVLCQTMLEYVAADLNTKVAAERLFVHVNTAHYRLGKIAEKTGCDLRSVSDVLELLIAIKLAQRHERLASAITRRARGSRTPARS